LYYSWLFCRLHYLITKYVLQPYKPRKVLDIGCGTGFQSYLYAAGGCFVTGIDISENMIKLAKNKLKLNGSLDKSNLILFPEQFDFVKSYNLLINSFLNYKENKCNKPEFILGNICQLPFLNNSFDHINCCGSVLNLIDNYQLSLNAISKTVKPTGTIFIEVESRWNMDRFWTFIDYLLRNKIGFNTTLKDLYQSILSNPFKHISISYPYGEHNNPIPIKLQLFTHNQIKKYFDSYNLRILKYWKIHSFTNLIPSILSDTNYPSENLAKIFKILCRLEELVPSQFPSCSKVYLLKRE
jgi:MPBQ/MSBQ methyltransferase